uniref:Lysosomal-associated transmembrane protein 4A n=1 Tax=Plectus sambesii TaxID=2011161 RepID=A0A914WKI9_9BILA
MSGRTSTVKKRTCCCGCMYIKTGALVIAILEAIGVMILMTVGMFLESVPLKCVFAAVTVMSGIFLACLIYGIHFRRAGFLLPFLGAQIIGTISVAILLLLSADFLTSSVPDQSEKLFASFSPGNAEKIAVVIIVLSAIDIIVQALFSWVIYTYYDYLRDESLEYGINSQLREDAVPDLGNWDNPTLSTPPPAYESLFQTGIVHDKQNAAVVEV